MGGRNDDENSPVTIVRSHKTSYISNISMSPNLTMDKSPLTPYLTRIQNNPSPRNLTTLVFFCAVFCAVAGDMVYVRSGDFGQLVTSSTARWSKGIAKEPCILKKPDGAQGIICRVYHTALRGVGLVSDETEGSVCNIGTQEGAQGSDKYQTISQSASRLVWTPWKRPNPPPTGAVAVSVKPQKFLAADMNSTTIGYLDPTEHLGSAIFANQDQPSASCLVLTEIEPTRYELSDIQLKRNKGFIQEDIVLAYGKLFYQDPSASDDWDSSTDSYSYKQPSSDTFDERKRGRVESILSYEKNNYDYWGQGLLMAKGLHTTIHLPDGTTKVAEWGLPLTQSGKTETMTAVADLYPGTAINVTLHGTQLNGEMSYWATLKTFYKDGSSSTRLMDNHRKMIEITDIRLEHSRPYFLANNSIVPEPTTTTTSTSTTTPVPYEDEDMDGGTEGVKALPVESSPHNVQADQSLHLMDGTKSAAASVALSHFTSASWTLGFGLYLSRLFTSTTFSLI